MKKIIQTKTMTTKEWLMARRNGICGSDASIILGINKHKSILELWQEKTNQIPIEETENNFTYFGHVLEPVIKREFMKRTGLKVRAVNYILQSEEHEWMLADIDGVVKEKDGSYSLFEAKTATEFKREIWEKGTPEEYLAQVQHYLWVTGFQKAYVCAIVGGNTYFCHEIIRDDAYINNLIEREYEFWQCVLDGKEPIPDGSKATSQFLNTMYAYGESSAIDLPDDAEQLAERYVELEGIIKELSEKKEAITNTLKSIMKNNEKGYAGKHIINWKTVTKKSLDNAKVKSFLGDTYNEYLTESTYRRFNVA